ncbi:MAG: cell division protein FtsB [Pseudomonadales bacterium]|nr:cell division protein FtsB [Pseudomonadales bacterium]MCP5331104.1 cell division protein FtsB [Pseudomonadales bacterium]MCP5343567.1 cell division protein FtsB [Pseudomonadales bacterium]
MKVLLSVLVVLFLVLQFNLWVGEGSYSQLQQLGAQVEEQKQENLTLAERNQELEGEVLDLKEGQDAIEERARSEFNMVKDGETLYIIVEE